MAQVKLHGFDKVMRNLNKEIEGIKGRSLKGLIRAAILIRRDMEHTSPRIPIDTGNLRASFYTVTSKGRITRGASPRFKGKQAKTLAADHPGEVDEARKLIGQEGRPAVALGFSAFYAFFVHEMVGAHFQRPGSGAKFFESALKRNHDKIVKVIQEEARLKK